MYRSPVLKKAVEILYMTEPWRTAIIQPWFEDVSGYCNEYKSTLPIAFLAFAACAVSHSTYLALCIADFLDSQYRNVLDSLVSGTEDLVPFSEVGYAQVYNDLQLLIKDDTTNFFHRDTVCGNLQLLTADVTI